jgi:hypothetical protein
MLINQCKKTWLWPMFMKRKNIIGETDSIMIGWAGRVARRRQKTKGQSVVTKKNLREMCRLEETAVD